MIRPPDVTGQSRSGARVYSLARLARSGWASKPNPHCRLDHRKPGAIMGPVKDKKLRTGRGRSLNYNSRPVRRFGGDALPLRGRRHRQFVGHVPVRLTAEIRYC